MSSYRILVIALLLTSCSSGPLSDQNIEPVIGSALPAQDESTASQISKNGHQRILRLHIRYKDHLFSVVDYQIGIANPTPLPRAADHAPLLVQTLSKKEDVLFSGGIHDPRLARLDIEDPSRSGAWQHSEIILNESTFQLKIPVEESVSALRIIDNLTSMELLKLDLAPYLNGKQP